jgi:hypothetical protein
VEFKTCLPGGVGDTYVCEDCFNKIEEEEEDEEEEWCEKHEQVMWKNGLKCSGCLEGEEEKEVSRVLITAEDEEWEEIYNSTGGMPGEPREHEWEPGTFYQTYGGGGGPGGAGGYWVRTGGNAVLKVKGNDFQLICGAILEVGFKKCRLRLLIK